MDFVFLEHDASIFMNLTDRTSVRRFPVLDFEFATNGGVHARIGLFGAVEQEPPPLPIGEMHQNRDAVRDTGVINGGGTHRAISLINVFISRTASRIPMRSDRETIEWPMCSSRTP